MTDEKKIEFLQSSFANLQNLVSLADTKANISMTLQTFFLGVLLGSSIISGIFNKALHVLTPLAILFQVLFFAFLISSMAGLIFCLIVIKARFPFEKKEQNRQGLFYFNHIAKFSNSKVYYQKISQLTEPEWFEELGKQVYNVSFIVSQKMKYLNGTLIFLIINIFLSMIITIISFYI
jgi:hypothetical protein